MSEIVEAEFCVLYVGGNEGWAQAKKTKQTSKQTKKKDFKSRLLEI